MNTPILSLTAALALSSYDATMARPSVGPATEQAAAHSVVSSVVGHWLYDRQGNIIGSVRSLTDDGRTAVILVGSYLQPGSHLTTVHINSLAIVNGKVTLQNETIQPLNTAFWPH